MNSKVIDSLPFSVRSEIAMVKERYCIDTPLRLSHFLSQCHHESGGFKHTTENLRYSSQRLLQVFPKYFADMKAASQYAMNPEKIGSRVYANRMGNGPESSQEGFLYRGRGYIQVTGKNKYIALDKLLPEDILKYPDLIATKYPMLASAWFWDAAGLNDIADKGSSYEICEEVTKKVNGGKNGLLNRWKHFVFYYKLFTLGDAGNGKKTEVD